MNVQERILNSQLLMAMEKYPDLSKALGLVNTSIELRKAGTKKEESMTTCNSPDTTQISEK